MCNQSHVKSMLKPVKNWNTILCKNPMPNKKKCQACVRRINDFVLLNTTTKREKIIFDRFVLYNAA